MADVRALQRIKTKLSEIEEKICDDLQDIRKIKTYIDLVNEFWADFRHVEEKLGTNSTTKVLVEEIETCYFKIKPILLELLHSIEDMKSDQGNVTMGDMKLYHESFLSKVNSTANSENQMELPKYNIPKFDGDFSKFSSFRDLFEDSIMKHPKLSDVQRFQYLKTYLTGEALSLITHIPLTSENFRSAWNTVKNRYEKKAHVLTALIDQFMSQPTINKPNAKSLRFAADQTKEVLRGLSQLGPGAETRDPWLIKLLMEKLDSETKNAWSFHRFDGDFPTLNMLLDFILERSDSLENTEKFSKKSHQPSSTKTTVKVHHTSTKSKISHCPNCDKEHCLYNCDDFKKMPVEDRRGFVASKRLCFNCLRAGHHGNSCRSNYRCNKCHSRHHSLLHTEKSQNEDSKNKTDLQSPTKNDEISTPINVHTICTTNHKAILPTAIVFVRDIFGREHELRILLDSAAETSFIRESKVQQLSLSRTKANFSIQTLTSGFTSTRGEVQVELISRFTPENKILIKALVLPKLPNKIPNVRVDPINESSLPKINYADPSYHVPGKIDLIVGANQFFRILKSEQMSICGNKLIFQNTMFGWIISGEIQQLDTSDPINVDSSFTFDPESDINATLKKFWELEEVPNLDEKDIYSPEEKLCEIHYQNNHTREKNGRYVVKIPFKNNISSLGCSLNQAMRRFHSLENKLNSNREFRLAYTEIINDYIKLGHLKEICNPSNENPELSNFYLPHHCVTKQTNGKLKLRVVFDGSCRSSTGISLNETMMTGPTIQPTLWEILMRFRFYNIALTADIEKMYRQIAVSEEHQDFQRILWRDNSNVPIKHYKLTRVTFGLTSSPFLAIRSLLQLASDNKETYPELFEKVSKNFYVDDFICGAENVEDAEILKEKMSILLESGKFTLCKWRSNVQKLSDNEDELKKEYCISTENMSTTSVLGISWCPKKDNFLYKIKPYDPSNDSSITKRKILSEMSKLFDPMGWLAPSVILGKIMFQNLWLKKLEWDDKVSEDVANDWIKFKCEIPLLENIFIDRVINKTKLSLQGFCDASEKAYSAVIYARFINKHGNWETNIISSKTKVAPIKPVTLPRLELCAAHLLSKLYKSVKRVIPENTKLTAWTDSEIVLWWLSDYPSMWKTFVRNRSCEILDIIPRENWNHISSKLNPADIASRGVFPSVLVNCDLWWHGPKFLSLDCSNWPDQQTLNIKIQEKANKEKKRKNIEVLTTQIKPHFLNDLILRISTYARLINVMVYIQRFISRIRLKANIRSFITAEEISKAKLMLIKWVQQQEFQKEFYDLKQKGRVSNKSSLLSLYPFLDNDDIIRVGGRLQNSSLGYDNKHPILLPREHKVTEMIITYLHKKYLHPGATLTSHFIRQQYWIVRGRNKIRNVVNKCVQCFKAKMNMSSQLMGNLPPVRIQPSRPFKNCGVDYAGPILLASKRGRGAKLFKAYIVLFVCMVTKAIHIELATDLSTNTFKCALKRFVARRGLPSDIHSDNATNFVGLNRELIEVRKFLNNINNDPIFTEYLAENNIQWHYIPPASPNFGGLWEAGVKSVKGHLNKLIKDHHLTQEEMQTILCEIEAILNSRPLCKLSEDDTTISALTPAHFLIGTELTSIPEKDVTEVQINRLNRFELMQQLVQGFWKRFQLEYLNSLHQRNKWNQSNENLKINDVVIIKNENLPPCKFALAKVIDIHPGEDGVVRVATLKTSTSVIKRSISKICKLPTS